MKAHPGNASLFTSRDSVMTSCSAGPASVSRDRQTYVAMTDVSLPRLLLLRN